MLKDIDGVIFDLDGTLVDSMWMWKTIDVEYLARFGLEFPTDLQGKIEGMSFSETAIYFKERFNLPDSLDQIKSDWNKMAWDKYLYEVPLKEGAREFLQYLKDNHIPAGIATSNSRDLVDLIIDKLNIAEFLPQLGLPVRLKRVNPHLIYIYWLPMIWGLI